MNTLDNCTGQDFLTGVPGHVGIVQEGSSVGDGAARPAYGSGPNPMPRAASGLQYLLQYILQKVFSM